MKFIFFVLIVLFNSQPLFAQAAASSQLLRPVGINSNDDKTLSRLPTPLDDQRNEKTLEDLVTQTGWFPGLQVSVHSGIVKITGDVKNREQLEWLAKTADRLPAVIAVINQATVIEPAITDLTPAWHEMKALLERAKRALPSLALTILFMSFFIFLGRRLHRAVESLWSRQINNPFLLSTVSKITMLPVWLIFFYLTLELGGLSKLATTIIGGTGILGIVLGFAFKDIAENYLSGILLAIRSPFTKGDLIQVNAFQGYVQSLDMRGTTIIDFDGNLILIPNTIVIQSIIQNQTANPNSRLSFILSIGYKDPVGRAQELISKTMASVPGVLAEPATLVVVNDVTSGNINLKVYFWYDSVKSSSLRVKSVAINKCQSALMSNGFNTPDGNTYLNFENPLQIERTSLKQTEVAKKDKMPIEGGNDIDSSLASVNQNHGNELKKLADEALERNPNLKSDIS